MKSVLISIKPQWCHKIIDREKTIEVRKTRPKLNAPFKCYIYCTAGSYEWKKDSWSTAYQTPNGNVENMSQRVIGEFLCDKITDMRDIGGEEFFSTSCMTFEEWQNYTDYTNHVIWAWHISNLKIYDKPKELYHFEKPCLCNEDCLQCKYYNEGGMDEPPYCNWKDFGITRPPQSWCYVEEKRGDNE